jgi:hypothetical protein
VQLVGISFALILPLLFIGVLLRLTPFTLAERTKLQSSSKKDASHEKYRDKVQSDDTNDGDAKQEGAQAGSEGSIVSNSEAYAQNTWHRHPSPGKFALHILEQLWLLLKVIPSRAGLTCGHESILTNPPENDSRTTHYHFPTEFIHDEAQTPRWRVSKDLSPLHPDSDLDSGVPAQETLPSPGRNDVQESTLARLHTNANSAQSIHKMEQAKSISWFWDRPPRRRLWFRPKILEEHSLGPDADLEPGRTLALKP